MSLARTETQILLEDLVERLLDDKNDFEKHRSRLKGEHPDLLMLWPELAEKGILGAALSEDAGGFGGTMRDVAVVIQAAGRRLTIEPILVAAVCARMLAKSEYKDHAADIVSGSCIVAFAHTEGSDPFAEIETIAEPNGGKFHLTGQKTTVRHCDLAHAFIVTAMLDGEMSAFLVDTKASGLSSAHLRLMDGSSAADITLKAVPALFLGGRNLVEEALAAMLVGLAAEAVAIIEAANAATFAYLQTRHQFGVPLSSFQALQHRAANMYLAATEASALCDRAINAIDEDDKNALSIASQAKAKADRAGYTVGHEAVQLHGGMGVSDELNVSHFMRRLAAIRSEFGQASIHFLRTGRSEQTPTVAEGFRAEVGAFVRAYLPEDIARKGKLGLEMEKEDYVRWQKILQAHGYFAGAWPTVYGGQGWDLERQLIFVQEAALNHAPMIVPYGVNMVGPVIYTFGSAEQKTRYLPDILSSDTWWCQGYSEPNAGSDLSSLKTTAIRDGDHFIVNGTKMWTTEAQWADMMHCLVRTDSEAKSQRGISFLLIDMQSPGISIHPIITIDGQYHTNQIFLDDVRVPVENLVGEEGQGWAIAKFLLANERVSIADTGPKLRLLGVLKTMLANAGDSIVKSLHEARLGELAVELIALTELEEKYVRNWAAGGSKEGPEASLLKIRGTEILQGLTELALEIQGPFGAVHNPADLHYSGDGPLSAAQHASIMAHQYLYGRCWSIFGGTNEIQRNIIAKSLLS
jgi:alkylation response protein AidB-like acyl-CoA dehydrogenase